MEYFSIKTSNHIIMTFAPGQAKLNKQVVPSVPSEQDLATACISLILSLSIHHYLSFLKSF